MSRATRAPKQHPCPIKASKRHIRVMILQGSLSAEQPVCSACKVGGDHLRSKLSLWGQPVRLGWHCVVRVESWGKSPVNDFPMLLRASECENANTSNIAIVFLPKCLRHACALSRRTNCKFGVNTGCKISTSGFLAAVA